MPCRMLFAVGSFSMADLLDDFRLMAQNRNEIHELNQNDPGFVHADGWGIVVGRSKNIEMFYKKNIACWKDPRFQDLRYIDADFVILHARKASSETPIKYSHTHPFEKQGWYFCHNGTVTDFLSPGKSDSEQLFSSILGNISQYGNMKEAIEKTVSQIRQYTALNFIFARTYKAFIQVKYRQTADYYTMKYLSDQDAAIVSSECLPSFKSEWTRIPNNTILELDIDKRNIEPFVPGKR